MVFFVHPTSIEKKTASWRFLASICFCFISLFLFFRSSEESEDEEPYGFWRLGLHLLHTNPFRWFLGNSCDGPLLSIQHMVQPCNRMSTAQKAGETMGILFATLWLDEEEEDFLG